jgi:hypothetical protein
VGFVTNHGAGCSPDSLIGDAGMLEIKTAAPHILIGRLLCDDFPPEHRAQCQGNLWVAEREWIDCLVYWPGMPPVVRRAERDEAFIKDLAAAVDQFNAELAEWSIACGATGRRKPRPTTCWTPENLAERIRHATKAAAQGRQN